MEIERIKFERTGGFAGMRFAADFSLDDLPNEEANTITTLLTQLDFNELPERMMNESSSSDQFTYTITVETKKWEHTVIAGDAPENGNLQSLIEPAEPDHPPADAKEINEKPPAL